MAESKKQVAGKQKRVRKLRKCNVQMLVVTIVMLALLCSILIARTQKLNETIINLTAQVEMLSHIVEEERIQAAHLREELQASRLQNNSADGYDPGGQQTAPEQEIKGNAQQTVQGQEVKDGVQQTIAQTAAHKVYLTFDDGPSSRTQDILDILDRYGVKATFFVVGKEGETAKESLKQIVEDGHTLGMHSGTHKYGELYASLENFAEDFKVQKEYLYEATGVECDIYRFPGGSSNTVKSRVVDMADLAKYLDNQGVRFFDWNISSGDGGSELLSVETLVENCTANISKYETSIILMHDSALKPTTLEALPKVIEIIQGMKDTVILPITDETKLVQHIQWQSGTGN